MCQIVQRGFVTACADQHVEAMRGNTEKAQKLLDEFFALPADEALVSVDLPSIVTWNAYQYRPADQAALEGPTEQGAPPA